METPVSDLFWKYGLACSHCGPDLFFPSALASFFRFSRAALLLLQKLIYNLFLLHLVYLAYWRRSGLVWLLRSHIVCCIGAWLHWVIGKNAAADEEKARLENENHITEPIDKNMTLMFPENDSLAIRSAASSLGPGKSVHGAIRVLSRQAAVVHFLLLREGLAASTSYKSDCLPSARQAGPCIPSHIFTATNLPAVIV